MLRMRILKSIFILFSWCYNSMWLLVSKIVIHHLLPSTVTLDHFLIPIPFKSSSTSSLPSTLHLLPINFFFFSTSVLFYSRRCSSHQRLSKSYNNYIYISAFTLKYVWILQALSWLCRGPNIFWSISRSKPLSITYWNPIVKCQGRNKIWHTSFGESQFITPIWCNNVNHVCAFTFYRYVYGKMHMSKPTRVTLLKIIVGLTLLNIANKCGSL